MGIIERVDCDRARKFIRTAIIPEIEHYSNCARERFLPGFNPESLAGEADRWAEKPYQDYLEEYKSKSENPPEDGSEVFDRMAFGYYDEMSKMGQAFTNLFTAGLYHVFEQHLLSFYLDSWLVEIIKPDWLRSRVDKKRVKINNVELVIKSFVENGININDSTCWKQIKELQLVANTIKHGRGSSSNKLEKQNSELFKPPFQRQELPRSKTPKFDPSFRHHNFQRTITGDHIFITPNDFDGYAERVHEFWTKLSTALPTLEGKAADEPQYSIIPEHHGKSPDKTKTQTGFQD